MNQISILMCWLVIVLVFTGATGCASTTVVDSPSPPEYLSLQLHMATNKRQYTYFELKGDGELHYGGGRMGMLRNAEPVTTLSAKQQQAVWDVIRKHQLLNADGSFIPDYETVKWELTVRTSPHSLGRTIRTGDDQVTGIRELHDLLFKYQSAVRFRDLEVDR